MVFCEFIEGIQANVIFCQTKRRHPQSPLLFQTEMDIFFLPDRNEKNKPKITKSVRQKEDILKNPKIQRIGGILK